MKHFPFGDIIKEAWKTTIHNTKLWWFGLFLGSGIAIQTPDFSDFSSSGSGGSDTLQSLSNNVQQILSNWVIVATIIGFVLLFFLVLFFISLLCRAAILHGLAKVKAGESYKFWSLAGLGAKKCFAFSGC